MNDTFTYFQKKGCTVFSFPGKTRVLSTSPLNGGITAHLTHALNINCMNGAYECEMLGNTYEEDLNIHTKELICAAKEARSWEFIRRQQPHSAQRHGLNCVLLRKSVIRSYP